MEERKFSRLYLSAISPWEVAKLVSKGKLMFSIDTRSWLYEALADPRLELLALSPDVSYESTVLPTPFHQDPADQIIVASARLYNATVLSRDDRIRKYRHVRSLW